MAIDIVVPPLGESISEAVIARWLKQAGESAAADEPVAELETDKVTVELRAPTAGVMSQLLFQAGATVRIGDVVARMEPGAAGKSLGGAGNLPASPEPSVTPAVPVEHVAQRGPSAVDGGGNGHSAAARAQSSQGGAPPETAQGAYQTAGAPQVRAPQAEGAGASTRPVVETEQCAQGGQSGQGGHGGQVGSTTAGAVATGGGLTQETLTATVQALLSRPLPPSVRQTMREHGGSAQAQAPVGPLPAMPMPSQVQAQMPQQMPQQAQMPQQPQAKSPSGPPQVRADEEAVAMSPLRKRIAERLVEAQRATASLTTFNEVDMSNVISLRERYKDTFLERHKVKLGFMSFFVKAALAALRDYPGVNAEIRGDHIVYKKHYDIGIAVGGGKGLVVPVIRNADKLSFAEIEAAIAEYGKKAKENKLTVEELSGGTFSITNGGIYGSMMSTPLLNHPQTGILGMHNIVKRPVAVGDKVEIRPVMYVALTYDHRVVDGREAVQFLVGLKERIESPERLLFAL